MDIENYGRQENGEIIELHVFIVPLKLWLYKYRTAYNKAVLESTSAGFIRIDFNTQLRAIRKILYAQLSYAVIPREFIFLRSVGRCLAVVNENQEYELLGKDFIPPKAQTAELLLLPCTHREVGIAVRQSAIHAGLPFSDHVPEKEEAVYSNGRPESAPQSAYAFPNGNEELIRLMSPTETRDSHRGDVTSFNGRSYSTKSNGDYRRNSFPSSIAGSNMAQVSRNHGPQGEAAPISVTANVKIDIPQKNPYLSSNDVYVGNRHSPSPLPASPLPPTVHSLQMPGIALVPATPVPITPELYQQQQMNDTSPVPNERDRDTTEVHKRKMAEEEEKRLLAMEARMKMRMEQEFERLKNESKMENFTDVVKEDIVQISDVAENNEEVSDNSDTNLVKQDSKEDLVDIAVSLVENAVSQAKTIVIGENDSPESPIDGVDQTLISDTVPSKEDESTRKSTEKQKKHSTVHDADEMISKLKEIEELKRKNIESKKRKQLEEEEKLQRELELQQQNKNKIEELKREIEKVKLEKHNHQKAREALVKRFRSLNNELNIKQNQKNNVWRKKYIEERRRTGQIEEQIKKIRGAIEKQHQKLMSSSASPKGFGKRNSVLGKGGLPSERTNQRNTVLKLQSENDDLKMRIELISKKLNAETKMKAFAHQELKDLRIKAIDSKINVSKTKKSQFPQGDL